MSDMREEVEAGVAQASDLPDEEFRGLAAGLAEMPGPESWKILEAVARTLGPGAVAALERIGSSPGGAAVLAVEALALVKDVSAADALRRLSESPPTGDVRKAARKALHRLASQRVNPSPREAQHQPSRRPSFNLFAAHASIIDGAGNRGLWLAFQSPVEVEVISLLASDDQGIKDAVVWEISQTKYQREIAKMRTGEKLPWVDLPVDYARHLLEQYHAINAREGTPLPLEYLAWRGRIGRPEQSYDRPIIYSVVNAAEIRWNPQYLDASGQLLSNELFYGWFLGKERLAEYVRERVSSRQSGLILPGMEQGARDRPLAQRITQQLFDARMRSAYKGRLEEMAFQLWQLDRSFPAKIALAAALALDPPDRPLHDHPFVLALVEQSLEVAVALSQGERTREIRPGIQLELPY